MSVRKGSTKSAGGVAPSPKLGAAASPSTIAAAAPSAAQPASASPSSASRSPANAATLQVFWDLASDDAATRASACQLLIQSLASEQKSYTASGGPARAAAQSAAQMEDAKMDGDDEDDEGVVSTPLSHSLAPPLSYALKRLSRGLASSRASARQGFALALTEILANFSVVSTEEVLRIVGDQVKLDSKANKQVG
jgi:DNA polymerase phi